MTNILIIVVRYFGGTKLGIPGLIRSYKNTTINAINNTEIVTKIFKKNTNYFFKYSYLEGVMKQIKKWELVILENNFNLDCRIKILVSKKKK